MKKKGPLKAISVLERWLKENCKQGEFLEIKYSSTALVITKAPTHPA